MNIWKVGLPIVTLSLLFSFPAFAFTPYPGTDKPASFYSCFYLGNVVNDPIDPDSPNDIEINQLTFHDGRAIQLYAMGQLADGATKRYIEENQDKISDFARKVPTISEAGSTVDWYDGRVAALTGLLWCADDVPLGEREDFPRANCGTIESLFPEGAVIERIKHYARPCCVLSSPEESVSYFPCQLPS